MSYKQQNECQDNHFQVSSLPDKPKKEAVYSFNKIPKSEIISSNHGLHKYPAKFIPHFPEWALRYIGKSTKKLNVLDPFCGSGTTLVEAGLLGHNCYGCDISPLASVITEAKTTIFTKNYDAEKISNKILASAKGYIQKAKEELDANANNNCLGMHWTWSNWFDSSYLARLLAIKYAIADLRYSKDVKTFSYACLSSIAKSASYLN